MVVWCESDACWLCGVRVTRATVAAAGACRSQPCLLQVAEADPAKKAAAAAYDHYSDAELTAAAAEVG